MYVNKKINYPSTIRKQLSAHENEFNKSITIYREAFAKVHLTKGIKYAPKSVNSNSSK